jgi:hypothetical protein
MPKQSGIPNITKLALSSLSKWYVTLHCDYCLSDEPFAMQFDLYHVPEDQTEASENQMETSTSYQLPLAKLLTK